MARKTTAFENSGYFNGQLNKMEPAPQNWSASGKFMGPKNKVTFHFYQQQKEKK